MSCDGKYGLTTGPDFRTGDRSLVGGNRPLQTNGQPAPASVARPTADCQEPTSKNRMLQETTDPLLRPLNKDLGRQEQPIRLTGQRREAEVAIERGGSG